MHSVHSVHTFSIKSLTRVCVRRLSGKVCTPCTLCTPAPSPSVEANCHGKRAPGVRSAGRSALGRLPAGWPASRRGGPSRGVGAWPPPASAEYPVPPRRESLSGFQDRPPHRRIRCRAVGGQTKSVRFLNGSPRWAWPACRESTSTAPSRWTLPPVWRANRRGKPLTWATPLVVRAANPNHWFRFCARLTSSTLTEVGWCRP